MGDGRQRGGRKTHAGRLIHRDEVSGALHEDVRPVALLVHDACRVAVAVDPGRGRAPREALDAAECRVLRAYQCDARLSGFGCTDLDDNWERPLI